MVSDVADTYWSADGNIVLEANGDTGRVDVFIGAKLTALINDNGIYELVITTDDNNRDPLVRGRVNTVLAVVP